MGRGTEYLEDIISYARKNEYTAIYGAGKVATGLYKDLSEAGINVACFIVTSDTGQPAEIRETTGGGYISAPVFQIDKVPHLMETGIVIGVSLGKTAGIKNKLEEYGVSNYVTLSQDYIDTILEEFKEPKLEITTVIGCAVNCRYCPQKLLSNRYWAKDREREREMSFETFRACLDKLPRNTQIYFAGMAEPFLNKECMHMIQDAVKKGYRVGVYTTCVGLGIEDCRNLVKMPIESVILHVPDEEQYARILLTEEYWEVVALLLNATKKDGSSFVDSGSCQGTPLGRFMELNNGRIRVESYLHDRAGNLPSEGVKLESCDYINGAIYCYHSGSRLDHNILLPDGTVVLCCMDYGIEHGIGNLLESSYEEIIHGKALNDIRAALKDETRRILCRKCTYAVRQ